ncbi:ABC transporter C-terminal domain-containing protein [Haloarcula amylolytica]|uniref:ABC transporter C-terminal domain-containing protein n=1 Tax=Haloarcula amylolytica TaxID=396317 RepID=UPI003C750210
MEYNATMVWFSRVVEYGRRHVENPVVASLLTMGWIPVISSLVAIDLAEASRAFLAVQFLAVLPVTFGPFIVWYYDRRVFPSFFQAVDEVVAPNQEPLIQEIADKYDRIISRYWWVTTLPFAVVIVSVFFVGNDYFVAEGITAVHEQVAYLIFFIYFALFTGFGGHAGIVMMATIHEFSDRVELVIEPLHPDNLGGLSTTGEFAIKTTVLLSTGSLGIPLGLQIATYTGAELLVYLGIGLYTVVLAGSFIYPTYRINKKAQEVRERELGTYQDRIRKLEDRLSSLDDNESNSDPSRQQQLQLEIQRTRQEFRDFRDVQLYPLSINIIIRLTTSVLLPIFFAIFEIFISDFF